MWNPRRKSFNKQSGEAMLNSLHLGYCGTEKGPYLDVLLSLNKLPKLRELSLSLNLNDDDTPYPLDKFSELRSLKFHSLRPTTICPGTGPSSL
jgi:hypothetical protein